MSWYGAAIIALFIGLALSNPIPVHPREHPGALTSYERDLAHCTTNPLRYASVSTYDVQWFCANIFHKPSIDFTHTLFYTAGMTDEAKFYACSRGCTTIWDVWPSELYDSSPDPSNKFSCIHNDKASRQTFFKTM
ncbi:hypothetical protein NX059_009917 [Plenodomus lindquistii]|nr:hypothetical protein NX059_009917 [Plenodomus lindquistii]